MGELEYEALTARVIGCSMKVHTAMGPGFPEIIYQRCLRQELVESGIAFEQEKELDIYYNAQRVGSRRVDFLIEEKVLIELKAVTELCPAHIVQALNYLKSHHLRVGLLINFGSHRLTFRRVVRSK